MSYVASGDDQSEDGELRQSPSDLAANSDINNFSLSEEDAETTETLDIKPPQARIILPPARSKRHETKSRHKRERNKDPHREKHHRSNHREKNRHYREQLGTYIDVEYFRESKEGISGSSSRHAERRELRYIEKQSRKDRYIEDKCDKASGDRELEDLRERLLSKRPKGDDSYTKVEKTESHRDRARHRELPVIDAVLEGESGMYVKEIINISNVGEEKRIKKQEKNKEEDKLTEEERAEQELRREKLLEAEREMARLKEQSRIERERRHLEKQAKRKHEEEHALSKRLRDEENVVVTVSDNSDNEVEINEDDELNNEEDENDVNDDDKSFHSHSTVGHSDHESRASSLELDDKSRSPSVSPKDNGNLSDNEVHEETETQKIVIDDQLPPYYPAIQGCRSVEEFQCLNRIEEGTYGVVYRARDKRTEEIVALKRLKMEKEKEGFPITSLREINTLLKGQHPNIVTVREIVVGSNMDKIFIVMDYVEHDLKSLMETMRHKKQSFTAGEVKCLIKQLLQAVAHLHDNWILHRDLKTSNLLLSHKGILKVGDFGLAREYGSPLKPYTPIVVTLWYRAPELLLCTKEYSTPIDMWSVGCIFGELLLMNPIFPGKSEIDQLNRVFKDLGTPNEKIWPGFNKLPAVQKMKFTEYPVSNIKSRFHMLSELGLLQLQKFLTFDPGQRIAAEDALQHPYFSETPLPIDPSMFPTWPAKSELGHRRALAASPKPPSGGREYKQLGVDEDGYGFRIGGSITDNRRIPMGGGFSLKF